MTSPTFYKAMSSFSLGVKILNLLSFMFSFYNDIQYFLFKTFKSGGFIIFYCAQNKNTINEFVSLKDTFDDNLFPLKKFQLMNVTLKKN